MKTEAEAYKAIEKYANTVRRICYLHLNNYSDTEDVFQDVFLKYVLREEPFESETHEKAWLIRVTVNGCKDMSKGFFKRRICSLEDMACEPYVIPEEGREVLDAVFRLPEKYRDIIYLFYYEGYTAVEIAKTLDKSENTVYTWLSRARTKLREILGGDFLG